MIKEIVACYNQREWCKKMFKMLEYEPNKSMQC